VIATFSVDDPTKPDAYGDIAYDIYVIISTILGAFLLNYGFKKYAKLKNNTKYSFAILIAHLLLIPTMLCWLS
jgi:hypothetical protein